MAFLVARDSPQTSSAPLTKYAQSSQPEIGGSYGGFIALVVTLAAIFVFSCIGIFILLRSHEPTPYERQMRRSRARSRSEFTTEAPIGPLGIRERFAKLFGRQTGWIKASGADGDEWDASDDAAPFHHHPVSELREREREGGYYSSMVSNPASRDPRSRVTPSASIEVELRAPSPDTPLSTAFQHDIQPSEDDGGHAAPVPFHVHASSLPPPPPPTKFPAPSPSPSRGERVRAGFEGDYNLNASDDGRFSVQLASQDTGSISVGSMRKFDNGTKFREGLTSES